MIGKKRCLKWKKFRIRISATDEEDESEDPDKFHLLLWLFSLFWKNLKNIFVNWPNMGRGTSGTFLPHPQLQSAALQHGLPEKRGAILGGLGTLLFRKCLVWKETMFLECWLGESHLFWWVFLEKSGPELHSSNAQQKKRWEGCLFHLSSFAGEGRINGDRSKTTDMWDRWNNSPVYCGCLCVAFWLPLLACYVGAQGTSLVHCPAKTNSPLKPRNNLETMTTTTGGGAQVPGRSRPGRRWPAASSQSYAAFVPEGDGAGPFPLSKRHAFRHWGGDSFQCQPPGAKQAELFPFDPCQWTSAQPAMNPGTHEGEKNPWVRRRTGGHTWEEE